MQHFRLDALQEKAGRLHLPELPDNGPLYAKDLLEYLLAKGEGKANA